MLLNVPVEVVIRISFYLETYEKIALMQTCKHLERVIDEHCLLNKVDLLDATQACNFLSYIDENESKKVQVRSLLFGSETSRYFTLDKLPGIFPKLEEITWERNYYRFSSNVKDMDLGEFKNLTETLKKLRARSIGYIIPEVLKISVFPKLTQVTVSFDDAYNRGYSNDVTEDVAALFKNAPNLKKLTFMSVSIRVKALEKLHACTPNLEDLSFEESTFKSSPEDIDTKNDKFKVNVKPNKSITQLNIIQSGSIQGEGMSWLKYISKKYKGLEVLAIDCYIECCGNDIETASGVARSEGAILELLSGCPNTLKSFYIGNYPITEKAFSTIDQKGIQLEEMHLLGCEKFKMDKLDALFNSQQIKSIKKLTINNLHIKRPISFKKLKKLNKLMIGFCGDKSYDKYLYLDSLLKECPPALEKLEIACQRITVTRDIHRYGVYKLKNLRMYANVDKTVYPFLNKHCNHITHLALNLTSYKRPAGQPNNVPIVDIDLPKLNLNLFTFYIRDCALYCAVKTQNKTTWYRLNPKSDRRDLRVKRLDDKKTAGLEQKKHIVASCKSVQFLYINNLHIY